MASSTTLGHRLDVLLVLLGCVLFGSVAAALPAGHHAFLRRDATAAALIAQIMPASVSCAGGTGECATNEQAAPYFVAAMQQYGLYSGAEIGGVLALVALESGQLKARSRADVPGQGTSNMQHVSFNAQYAGTFPALAGGLAAAGSDAAAILALVTPDAYNFGTGPWFLATQCSADVRAQLRTGTDAGFAAYMGCVGVPATADRLAYWHAAQKAFSLV